jgi:hypothetical protein
MEIILSSQKSWRRNRFTLAHEIVHILLLRSIPDVSTSLGTESVSARSAVEELCDIGAAEILIPASVLHRDLLEWGIDPGGLLSIYDRYLVSGTAILSQISRQMVRGSAIIWSTGLKRSADDMLPRVALSVPGYRQRTTNPWLPKGCSTRHISPDIVSLSISGKQPRYTDELTISLNRTTYSDLEGTTSFLSRYSRNSAQLPIFEGFKVADDFGTGGDVILFTSDRIRHESHGLPQLRVSKLIGAS